MSSQRPAQRILVQPDGSAIVVRTPYGRSARFRTLDDALRWHEGQGAVVLPMIGAGVLAAVAKAIAPDDLLLPAIGVILTAGMIGATVVWARTRGQLPEPTWMSWEDSVRADDRDHPMTDALRDAGAGLGCGALLALVVFLIHDDPYRFEHLGALEGLALGVFVLALCVGVGFGAWALTQRLRYAAARSRSDR